MIEQKPLWADRQTVRRLYGISGHRLDEFSAHGLVRTAKLTPSRQGGRVFSVLDCERILDDLSSGREPSRAPSPRYRPTRRPNRRTRP